MAKTKHIWNISTGILGLPNGVQIGPGESIEIGEFSENAGVLSWVADGLASFAGPGKVVVVKSEDVQALEAEIASRDAQIADMTKALEIVTAERDDALAKVKALEEAKT